MFIRFSKQKINIDSCIGNNINQRSNKIKSTTISFNFVYKMSVTEWVKSNIFLVTTRVTMKVKLERWFSKAYILETVSLFTLDSGFKQKNSKVFTTETNSSSRKSRPSILATHRVLLRSSSFVFTFLASSLERINFSKWSALIGEKLEKYVTSLTVLIRLLALTISQDEQMARFSMWLAQWA